MTILPLSCPVRLPRDTHTIIPLSYIPRPNLTFPSSLMAPGRSMKSKQINADDRVSFGSYLWRYHAYTIASVLIKTNKSPLVVGLYQRRRERRPTHAGLGLPGDVWCAYMALFTITNATGSADATVTMMPKHTYQTQAGKMTNEDKTAKMVTCTQLKRTPSSSSRAAN